MYAGINDIKAIMVFLKKYLHGREIDTQLIYSDYNVYWFEFADGEMWTAANAGIFERWARELKSRGLMNVFAYDMPDGCYGYEPRIYCAFTDTPRAWEVACNLNADGHGHPEKRYFSEYTETVLAPDTPAPYIADPAAKLERAVAEYIQLVNNVVKYDRYSAGPDYFIRQLQAITDNLHGSAKAPPILQLI